MDNLEVPEMKVDVINGPVPIYHCGPELSKGALPALFYFALSGEDSLSLDPFNQPVQFLAHKPLHIFSLTIPGHGKNLDNHQAMHFWAKEIQKGSALIEEFSIQCIEALNFLIEKQFIAKNQIAAAGLSRGAFIAAHFAAKDSRINTLLCFAPLTRLSDLPELVNDRPELFESLSLIHLADKLSEKKIRSYIGNRDTRVNTDSCYAWIKSVTEASYLSKNRSPPVELIIYPSIGHKGHGTPKEIFHQGAEWVSRQLGAF